MSGSRLTVNAHIVTAAINNVKNLVRSVQSTGLNVENIVLEPLASSRAILSEDQKELGVALVDIGGGTTDITVFKNSFVKHTGVIGYGVPSSPRILHPSFRPLSRRRNALKNPMPGHHQNWQKSPG